MVFRLYNTLAARSRARPNPSLSEVGEWMDREAAARPVDAAKVAKMVIAAGEMARGRVPPPLPPKGSIARLVIEAGAKARNEKIPDE
jgi:hypothetical protein